MSTALSDHPEVVVRQIKEMLEILTDFETGNRYGVHASDGTDLLFAAEMDSASGLVLRQLFKNGRPFTLVSRDPSGADVARFRRPWTWILSELIVEDSSGRELGRVTQRWSFFSRRYALTDASGRELGVLKGSLFRPWTFTLERESRTVGKISKQWGGLTTEVFTDADTFGLQFDPEMDEAARLVMVGAAFLVDFIHFEDEH